MGHKFLSNIDLEGNDITSGGTGIFQEGKFFKSGSDGAKVTISRSTSNTSDNISTDDVFGTILLGHFDVNFSNSLDGASETLAKIHSAAEQNFSSVGSIRHTKMVFSCAGTGSGGDITQPILTLNGSDKSADFAGPVNFNFDNRVGDGKSIRFGAQESNGNDASSIKFNDSTSKLEITADEASNNEIELTGIVSINGEFNFKKSGFTSITASSNSHAVDFSTNTNNYNITATNATNTITFSGLSSSVIGKSGSIIITNPSSVGSLAFAALPNTAYTPGGSTISFDTTASAIAVISYLIIASNKVLVNYVGAFKQYGT